MTYKLAILLGLALIGCGKGQSSQSNSPLKRAGIKSINYCEKSIYFSENSDQLDSLLNSYLFDKEFYVEGDNSFYIFNIYVNSRLQIDSINIESFSNLDVAQEIKDKILLLGLEFKLLNPEAHSNCDEYKTVIAINSLEKVFLYPNSLNFYQIQENIKED